MSSTFEAPAEAGKNDSQSQTRRRERLLAPGPKGTDGKNPDVDKAVEALDTAIDNLLSDGSAFANFLAYKGRMHSYSWNNLLLIIIDHMRRAQADPDNFAPDSPILTMGAKGWNAMGRRVKREAWTPWNGKGGNAITLLAPKYVKCMVPKAIDPETGEPQGWKPGKKLVGFEVIRKTYHVQDTEGPDYAPPAPVALDDDSEAAKVATWKVHMLATTHPAFDGLTVKYRTNAEDKLLGKGKKGPHGYQANDPAPIVVVRKDMSAAQKCKTLVHELTHFLADHLHEVQNTYQGVDVLPDCEAVAEGTAFAVMSYLGFDTTSYSAPYIAGWTKDKDRFRRALRDINDLTKLFISGIESLPKPQEA